MRKKNGKVTVQNLDIALRMCQIQIDKSILDRIIDLVELIEEKGDNPNIEDVCKLQSIWSSKSVESEITKNECDLYGFLWFGKNGTEHNKYIKAKNIDSAIKKFLARKPKSMTGLDYEVHNGDIYIDISNRSEFSEYL